LSGAARRRLMRMDYYRACGGNARLTCQHFDINAQTFYRWSQRYSPCDLTTLESRSRPRRLHQPSWSAAREQTVLKLLREYPRR
jgi:transposase